MSDIKMNTSIQITYS